MRTLIRNATIVTMDRLKIEIQDPGEARDKFIPIYIAGGKGIRDEILNIYKDLGKNPEELYKKNRDHYENLHKSTLRINTPDKKLNLAYEWAKIAFDNLIVDNPDLGKGLVAGLGASGSSGRPGFGWFFGGDAFINTFSLLCSGSHKLTRDILAFTQKWQRKDGEWNRPNTLKLTVLAEEFGEVARAILEENFSNLKEELVQVAAVTVAWLESI